MDVTATLHHESTQKKALCSAISVWRQLASRSTILQRRLEAAEAQKQTSLLRRAFKGFQENKLIAEEAQAHADKASGQLIKDRHETIAPSMESITSSTLIIILAKSLVRHGHNILTFTGLL